MKKLTVEIKIQDSDHNPQDGAQCISVITNAPWLTAGRIIKSVCETVEAEGCKVEYDGLLGI